MSKRKQFRNLMSVMKLDGFYLIEDKKIMNGHMLKVGIPPTSSYENFLKAKPKLEDYFKGIIEIERIRFASYMNVKIITKDIGNYKFAPVESGPSKLYIGKEFDGNDYFVDLNKDAHVLIAGVTGTGKSFLLASMLTNLIYNHSKFYDIYLCQTAKRDIDYLKNCKGVKATLYTENEISYVLNRALKEINRRSEIFSKLGTRGIEHYNKVSKYRMKRQLYVFEEISLYEDCENIWNNIWKIVKLGRESGIHIIALTQRTTAANLGGSGEIKSQLARITFRQAQAIDSCNCIDCDLATKLKDREVYCLTTDGLKLIKVPTVDMDRLNEYVPEIKCYNSDAEEIQVSEEPEHFETYIDMRIEDYERLNKKPEKKVKSKRTRKGVVKC